MQPKGSKGKKAKATKAAPPPKPVKKVEESEDSDDSDDSSEEEAPAAKAVPAKKTAKKTPAKEESSEESDSSEEEEAKPAAKAPAKKAPAKKEESDDDDSDEEESEEEEAAPQVKKAAAKEESSDDDDSDDDEEEEEAPKKAAKRKAADSKAEGAKKAKNGKADDDDDESDDDDDEEESDDSDDDDEEDEEPVNGTAQKRKAKDSKKEPEAKKAKVDEEVNSTLFVGNIPADLEDKKLKKFFEKKGINVKEIRRNERKPMIGHVDLEDPSQMEQALELNGEELKGSALKIEQARPKGQKPDAKSPFNKSQNSGETATLFMKNFSYDQSEDEVRADVQGLFPDATEIRIPCSEGRIKGFVYVEMGSKAEVQAAIDSQQGVEVGGRSILLDFAAPKTPGRDNFSPRGGRGGFGGGRGGGTPGAKTKTLFVKNLSFNTTDDSLQGAFDGALAARVMTFPDTGKSKGFGFVDFDSVDSAESAYNAMSGQSIDGRQVGLDYAAERGSGGGGGRGGGGRGGFRGGRGGFGDRGGFRGGRGGGGRGGFRGGRGGGSPAFNKNKGSIQEFKGTKKSFD